MSSPARTPPSIGGDIPAPEDPEKIRAALRAGRVSYRLFPYYEWRYGDRGRLFTATDSAWLAWLTEREQGFINSQIEWLWVVLSSRGMPGRLLAVHLRILRRQLVRVRPEEATESARLLVPADRLDRIREDVMPEAVSDRLSTDFGRRFRHDVRRYVFGVGQLVTAAVADEARGVTNAVSSLLDWLGDGTKLQAHSGLARVLSVPAQAQLQRSDFPGRWERAVRELEEEARSIIAN